MAYHYIGGDRDQLFLLPVSMRDWLEQGHLAWFVIDVVERIDTCGLHVRHRNDGVGRVRLRPRHDARVAVRRVCDRVAFVTEDRSVVSYRCGLPGHLR
jgi:hypothetical protein